MVSAVIDDRVLGPEAPEDPEKSAWWDAMSGGPHRNWRSALAEGLNIDTATDILLTLCGDSVWVQLTTDRG